MLAAKLEAPPRRRRVETELAAVAPEPEADTAVAEAVEVLAPVTPIAPEPIVPVETATAETPRVGVTPAEVEELFRVRRRGVGRQRRVGISIACPRGVVDRIAVVEDAWAVRGVEFARGLNRNALVELATRRLAADVGGFVEAAKAVEASYGERVTLQALVPVGEWEAVLAGWRGTGLASHGPLIVAALDRVLDELLIE